MERWRNLSNNTKRLIMIGVLFLVILSTVFVVSLYVPTSFGLQSPPRKLGNAFPHSNPYGYTSWYTEITGENGENFYHLSFIYPANLTISNSQPVLGESGYYVNIRTRSASPNILNFVKSVKMTLFCTCLYHKMTYLQMNNSWILDKNDSYWAATPSNFFAPSTSHLSFPNNVLIFDSGYQITYDSVIWSQIGKLFFTAYGSFDGYSRIVFCTNSTVASQYYQGVHLINQTSQIIASISQVMFLIEVVWSTHYGIWGSSIEYNQSYILGDGDGGDWNYILLVP